MPTESRYYFLSSLPMLRFGEKAPLDWDSFMQCANERIPSSDMKLLKAIANGDYSGSHFLREWKKFSDAVDNSINARRRVALGKADSFVSEDDFDVAKFANAVMNAKNPLDAELAILRFKYSYLEQKLAFKAFSQDVVVGYALELRLLLRNDKFTVDAGNEQYRMLFEKVQKEVSDSGKNIDDNIGIDNQ